MGEELPAMGEEIPGEELPVMGEEIPASWPRSRPIPLDPCPVYKPCRACGRYTSEWFTWGEVHRMFGFAQASCMTCLLTEFPRVPPADVPRTATML